VFNVPRLGKHHLRSGQDREWIGVRPDGRRVYRIHPWEKGIAPVEPWTCVDVSIRDYLDRMAQLGENPDDYDSIWFYH
jgi:lysine 2,3-aminomutase